ncbi:hypothetical protein [Microtetraspora malaysiensis]|uniref:hypothetical protein n=1 Tax=Microtetraspora malaysiensis TaxID=161358 RepID=UPI003D92ED45
MSTMDDMRKAAEMGLADINRAHAELVAETDLRRRLRAARSVRAGDDDDRMAASLLGGVRHWLAVVMRGLADGIDPLPRPMCEP